MSYIDATLVPGEEVVYQTRLHWVVMLGHILFSLVLVIAGAGQFVYLRMQTGLDMNSVRILIGFAALLAIVGVAAFIVGMARRNATEMAVTTRRVVIKTGLVAYGGQRNHGRKNPGIWNDCDHRNRRYVGAVPQDSASLAVSQPGAATN